jgi:hypothetical protein
LKASEPGAITDPLKALGESVFRSIEIRGSFSRADNYLSSNCQLAGSPST